MVTVIIFQFPSYNVIDPSFKPVIDGHVLPGSPLEMFSTSNFRKVPFMTGVVYKEFGMNASIIISFIVNDNLKSYSKSVRHISCKLLYMLISMQS